MSVENLLHAFNDNHAALLRLVRQDLFDINALVDLVNRREDIMHELTLVELCPEDADHVRNQQEVLSTHIADAQNRCRDHLDKLGDGGRALKAYGKPDPRGG